MFENENESKTQKYKGFSISFTDPFGLVVIEEKPNAGMFTQMSQARAWVDKKFPEGNTEEPKKLFKKSAKKED
jgi:hypothetical protein